MIHGPGCSNAIFSIGNKQLASSSLQKFRWVSFLLSQTLMPSELDVKDVKYDSNAKKKILVSYGCFITELKFVFLIPFEKSVE